MGTLNRNTGKKSFMGSLILAMASAFGSKPRNEVKHHNPGKNARSHYRRHIQPNAAGSKIRRAIRRGNHGLVNKHGMIGNYFAELKRERYLLSKGKPVIRLSTTL